MPLIPISYSSVSCCRLCLRCAKGPPHVPSAPRFLVDVFSFVVHAEFEVGILQRIFISPTTDFHFANYRFSFRKLQILISQTTDFHFGNCRFSFRKLQILISQTTDFHFANYRFSFRKLRIFISFRSISFRFVSLHFVSQTTVSRDDVVAWLLAYLSTPLTM